MLLSREQALGLGRIHFAKLTLDDVLLILRVAEGLNGTLTRKTQVLGEAFNVHRMTVEDILTARSWAFVTVPYLQAQERWHANRRPRKRRWLKRCPDEQVQASVDAKKHAN